LTTTSWTQTSGLAKLILVDTTFTASGGSFGPFRYFALWNDTPTSPADPLIAWWDYGSEVTLDASDTMLVDFDATNGCLSLQ
jgi:hypothetical protein